MNYKFIVTAVLVLNLFTQIHAIARADIVPYPISNRETGCTFTLPEKQTVYGTSTELRQLAEIFIDRIIQDGFTGFSTTSSEQNALVKLQIDSSLAEEAYLLDSSTNVHFCKQAVLLLFGRFLNMYCAIGVAAHKIINCPAFQKRP